MKTSIDMKEETEFGKYNKVSSFLYSQKNLQY